MSRNDALMTRARRLNPAPADAFKNLAQSSEAQDMLDRIVQTPPADIKEALSRQGMRRLRSTRRLGSPVGLGISGRRALAVIAAAAVVLGVTTLGTYDRPGRGGDGGWTAELVSMAEKSPRLLLDQEAWSVTYVSESNGQNGEMEFEHKLDKSDCNPFPDEEGCSSVFLSWRPAGTHEMYVEDRKAGADTASQMTIDGHEAVVFEVGGPSPQNNYSALWLDGQYSVELRGVIPTLREFRAVAETLHGVDVDTWLSALPASAVKPNEREDAVDKILADVAIPDNVDLEELKRSAVVSRASEVDGEVTTAIVCGWIQQWIDGRRAGDDAAVREAVRALSRSRDWKVMSRYGLRTEVAEVADAMATSSPVYGIHPPGLGYQRLSGCVD